MRNDRVTVVVLEDHRIVGEGVASALEATGAIRAEAVVGSLAALREHIARRSGEKPLDVVVADIDLGGEDSLGLPAELAPAGIRVLFLSMHAQAAIVRAAVESGGAGLVHKLDTTEALAAAVHRAADGGSTFSIADLALARSAPPDPSAREREVLRCIVHGLANKEAAGRLGIEERTVESHVRRMLDRYARANRTELAVLALRQGWVDADG